MLVSTIVKTDPVTGDSLTRQFYTYDAQKRFVLRVEELKTDSGWVNRSRLSLTYDPQGELIERAFDLWAGGWQTILGTRIIFTYNVNNEPVEVILQFYDPSISGWYYSYKNEITYDASGKIILMTGFYRDNVSSRST